MFTNQFDYIQRKNNSYFIENEAKEHREAYILAALNKDINKLYKLRLNEYNLELTTEDLVNHIECFIDFKKNVTTSDIVQIIDIKTLSREEISDKFISSVFQF